MNGSYLYVFFNIYYTFLDSLVDPLQKTVNFKPKQDVVKQEVDRNEDMIRSALRAVASLNRIRCVLFFFYLFRKLYFQNT